MAEARSKAGTKKRAEPHDERPISPPTSKRKALAGIQKTSDASFFMPASKKPKERTTWTERSLGHGAPPTLLVGRHRPENDGEERGIRRRKMVAFDLDSTLIVSASGKTFAYDASDWKWWHPCVPGRLQKLYREESCRIVILTNQAGLALTPDAKSKAPKSLKERVPAFKRKCARVLAQLDIPLTLYAATGKDMFRKPCPGMWDEACRDWALLDGTDGVDLDGSVFVGDAGGRVGAGEGKKDFGCSDRNLAANVGIRYQTPEEFFLGETPRSWARELDLGRFPFGQNEGPGFEKRNDRDVVLFVGPPGAARTDNTNADAATRAQWIDFAKKRKVPVRCVWFRTPLPLCEHNNAVRALNKSMNPEAREMLPKMAFTGFASRFSPPKVEEGFQEIMELDFKFRGSQEEYGIWGKYWL